MNQTEPQESTLGKVDAQYVHPAFPQPASPEVSIWRYLTCAKFDWLMQESRLLMVNAGSLGDPLEGLQPTGDAAWWDYLAEQASSNGQRQTIEHNRSLISRFAQAFRTRYYVSCWHVNEAVNPAMWTRYASDPASVAVRTTFRKLRRALPRYVEIGLVRYIDYAVARLPSLNMFEYIMHKNHCFQDENELRAVAMHPVVDGPEKQHFESNFFESQVHPGMYVFAPSVDVGALVEAVLLHPDAPSGFAGHVEYLSAAAALPSIGRATW